MLFLLAQTLFLRGALEHVPRSRPVGVAALMILAVATTPLPLIVGIAASSAVLVAVAVADTFKVGAPAADGDTVPSTVDTRPPRRTLR